MNDLISKAKLKEHAEKMIARYELEMQRFTPEQADFHTLLGSMESMRCFIDFIDMEPDEFRSEPISSLQPGDKVKHVDECWAEYGIGVVKELSKTGKSARISWPNYDRRRFIFGQPGDSNILLRKLRKVESHD